MELEEKNGEMRENGEEEEEELDGLVALMMDAQDTEEDDDGNENVEMTDEKASTVMQKRTEDAVKSVEREKHVDGVVKEVEKQEKSVKMKRKEEEEETNGGGGGGAFRFGDAIGEERGKYTRGEGVESMSQLKVIKPLVPLVVIAERFRRDTGDFVFVNVARLETAMHTVQDRRWATIAVLADRSRIFESGGSSSMAMNRTVKDAADKRGGGAAAGGGEAASSSRGGGGKYMVWTLTDLAGARTAVFLFGDAYAAQWKMEVGSVVMVANMTAMKKKHAAKPGRDASSVTFSVDKSQQVQKIGTSADFEMCRGTKQDGSRCTMAVHRRDGYCHFHAAQGLRQLRQKVLSGTRMEFSSGNLASAMRPKGKNGNFLRDALLARKRPSTAPKKEKATAAQLRVISAMTQTAGRADAKNVGIAGGGNVGVGGAESRGSRFLTSVADFVEQRTMQAGAATMPSTTTAPRHTSAGGGSGGCRSYVPAVSLRKVDTKQMTYNGGKMLDAPAGMRRPGVINSGGGGGGGRGILGPSMPVSGTQNVKRRREEQETRVCPKTGGVMWMPRAPRPAAPPVPRAAKMMMELPAMPATAAGASSSDPAIAELLKAIKANGKPNPNVGTRKRAKSSGEKTKLKATATAPPPRNTRTIEDDQRKHMPEPAPAPSSRRIPNAALPDAKGASAAPATSTHTAFAAAFGDVLKECTNKSDVRGGGGATSSIDARKSKYDAVVLPSNEMKLLDTLEVLRQEEDLADKLDAVRQIQVRVHTCITCSPNLTSEKPLTMCASKGHSILSAKGVKRFFSCRACKTRTTTLNSRYPKKTCLKCGADTFVAVGMSAGPKPRNSSSTNADMLLPRGEEHAFSLKQDLC